MTNDDMRRLRERNRRRRAAAYEQERSTREEKARLLRVLHDVACDRYLGVRIFFEQHYGSGINDISSFAVIHDDKLVRKETKDFIRLAIPRIGLQIDWQGRDVIDTPMRLEPATENEKQQLLRDIWQNRLLVASDLSPAQEAILDELESHFLKSGN
ncbi:hypothetical protein [Antarctobacter jejuensis]|uniref:hypothetical protein n=1 Tax=Antarctobacter jejuensis TaxID=1439938 RepID=UPI003FD4B538